MARVRVEDFSVLATSRLLSALTGCRVGSSSVVSQFRSPASRPSPSAIDFCLNVVVLLLSDIFFPNGLIVVPSLSLSAVVPSLSLRSSFFIIVLPFVSLFDLLILYSPLSSSTTVDRAFSSVIDFYRPFLFSLSRISVAPSSPYNLALPRLQPRHRLPTCTA
ncbi:hypothetical protein ACLOJK_007339 [Asimina triloba]